MRVRLRSSVIMLASFIAAAVGVAGAVPQDTDLVSRQSDAIGGPPGLPGDGPSTSPSVSKDGRFVAFTSAADNLGMMVPCTQIWVRDTVDGTTTLVSREDGEAGLPANNCSFAPN